MKASGDAANPTGVIDCRRGLHAPLIEQPPLPFDDTSPSVEVDWVCSACGRVVETVSWTRAAWDKRTRGWDPGAPA
jgi:hypothetical protein